MDDVCFFFSEGRNVLFLVHFRAIFVTFFLLICLGLWQRLITLRRLCSLQDGKIQFLTLALCLSVCLSVSVSLSVSLSVFNTVCLSVCFFDLPLKGVYYS